MAVIYISVGSNIERHKHIVAGLDAMAAVFNNLRLSPVYESKAVGFEGSDFYNLVVEAHTALPIADVVAELKRIEDNNGRVRGGKKFAPRTLDLDLLLYDDVVCEEPIELPRDEILHNAFVLLPLCDIAPALTHPLTGQCIADMWHAYDKQKQQLWAIPFAWQQAEVG
ncbi:2-amino-4-hydroxy-6-hydroxymethyldihydropteridine diphosphokinase [Bowmanella sp. JS7-9]|uniref:2-amino-4-hydroxy-6-hydroxymethyldihydropteridine diphosphokinase n=1 Tax=Pseudobowmanella zhangzhouensis TaxID=1537679 RepID=A0ABW1XL24_9ALTE|nr:2-amino-4-hydroxy-6-hydroxymethyldihydropteridine diphosphokinase [Bowmanella sp. JS7-9]TBX20305.1 2-amino-4-hydroxy-6-hydroxymethyldihydropteridine pyrophosphokinase [Bowmanella sp. JS7-9]